MDSAQWKTYNYQLMGHGRYICGYCPDGFWFRWMESVAALGHGRYNWATRHFGYVVLRGSLWSVLLEGNIEKKHLYHSCTQDYRFQKVERVADKSELPSRFYHPFVFRIRYGSLAERIAKDSLMIYGVLLIPFIGRRGRSSAFGKHAVAVRS